MITEESIHFLSDTLGSMYAIEKLNEGFQNEIYKIKSQKGEYCLRISKRNSPKHVQYEIDILRCLTDLPVINLQSVNGEYIFSVSGKTAILYSYIDGEIKHNNTDEELRIAGAFLADFHNSCHDIGYLETRFEYYNLSEQIIEEHKNIINDSLIPYREFLPEIIAGLSLNILSKKLPSGPIHVDLGPKNVLWKDGELAAVLDFDNAYNGPRVLDIGKSIMFFASYKGVFCIPRAKVFFAGYISRGAISSDEKEEMYKAIQFAFLSHIFVDYYMYAKKITTDTYFDYIINDLFISYKSFKDQLVLNPNFLFS